MAKADRYREKMLRGLVRALDDEASHVRRYGLIGKACTFLGSVVLVLAVFAALNAGEGAQVWFVVSGAVAGLLLGLAVFFNSSVEQWPVTREFLDVDAIRQAARRHGP